MSQDWLTQRGMPVLGAGAGQTIPQPPQFTGSRVRSLQPLGQVAQSVPLVLQPFVHCMVPAVHMPFALHIPCNVRMPFAHDCAAPHSVPEPLLPDSTQTDEPVAHDVVPVLHWFAGWQAWFAVHDTQ